MLHCYISELVSHDVALRSVSENASITTIAMFLCLFLNQVSVHGLYHEFVSDLSITLHHNEHLATIINGTGYTRHLEFGIPPLQHLLPGTCILPRNICYEQSACILYAAIVSKHLQCNQVPTCYTHIK
jgi:hypothetical protein